MITDAQRAQMRMMVDVTANVPAAAEASNAAYMAARSGMANALKGESTATIALGAAFLSHTVMQAGATWLAERTALPLPEAYALIKDLVLNPHPGVLTRQFDKDGNEI